MTGAGTFTAFLPPAVRDAGLAGVLLLLTFREWGIRFLVPRKADGFGMQIFHMLTAEYANADNDNTAGRLCLI